MCGYKLKLSTSTFYIDSTIISQAVHVALKKRAYTIHVFLVWTMPHP